MRVLVTGGAGFIGSHLVDQLMARGYEVTVIDNLSGGTLENLSQWNDNPKFNFVKADLTNYDDIEPLFKNIDAVFHFAANPDVKVGSRDPHALWKNNVVATYNALEASRKARIKYFVFASSSTVYGENVKLPTPEDSRLEPISIFLPSSICIPYSSLA